MKKNMIQKLRLAINNHTNWEAVLLRRTNWTSLPVVIMIMFITSCAPEMKITSSWANRQINTMSSPTIMVAVIGKTKPEGRKDAEKSLVDRLKKAGYKAVPASSLFQPGVKQDSAELVSILRKNNIDMLLTNAIVNIVENERFIPGVVQGESVQLPTSRYSSPYYYYGLYDTYSMRTVDAPKTMGTTVTDVQVMIESNLYEISSPLLIWHAQSTVYTKEPSKKLFNAFSKMAVNDIEKHKLLKK